MGVIKDGTITGFLPDNVSFAVHYPGYPSSTSRAIDTLGGSEAILKERGSPSEPLKLHFRPEDPYSHPAFGDRRPCNNFLLKISKKRTTQVQDAVVSVACNSETRRNGQECTVPENALDAGNSANQPAVEGDTMFQLSADIVARVSEAYHFNGMVDYQHVLAVHAHAGKNKSRKRDRAELEPYSEKGAVVDVDQDDVMILVPPLFSPKDLPEKLVLKPSVTVSAKKKQEAIVKQRWEMQIEPCLAIDYNIEEIPRKINWEDHITRGSDHWEWQKAVSVLFDERPIWHTISLNHRLLDKGLRVGAHMFKRLLFRTAYYFSTGPYRQLWIRKGYDPRKDPESRIYQRIDFRVPPPLRHIGDVHSTDKLKHMWKDLCALRVFPCKCQISLQLFELDDDYIREEIRKPPEDTCLCSTGWFSSFVHDSLKLCIAVRFLSVYPKMGAESLLKSASLRFEKSKRARALKSDFRPKEMEHQLNKESSSHLSKVSPTKLKDTDLVFDNGKDEYDDDEDNNDGYDYIEEEEEEDEEEEMDEYESYQVDAGDGDFTLNPLSYPIGENISKNYLQELFGSFPSTEAASNKDQEVEFSDAEYQIFEQDSDDNANYSGDDDY